MSIALHDAIGMLGSALIVVSYLLLQLRKIEVRETKYSVINALGAGGILYSLSIEFNLSAFVIEFFWLVISFIGIFQSFKEPPRSQKEN
ncbi:MAG: hypothetical protein KJO31_13195 [Gammaproteobacteria bacterium]|nr:hypothetical protein [Gammaproteobacteria bacterium]